MNWLRKIMYGRYGYDRLGMALLIAAVVFSLLATFTGLWLFSLLSYALIILCFFRMFSRNINRRYEENRKFMDIWNKVKSQFTGARTRISESRTHRFYKCPSCKKRLRVPKGKGLIRITCAHCGFKFEKKT